MDHLKSKLNLKKFGNQMVTVFGSLPCILVILYVWNHLVYEHTIEVLNGLIKNKFPWDLGGDLRIEAF
jgi:hypothetical protein